MQYKSSVQLDHVYKDVPTGYQGTATAIIFFVNGSIRVELESAEMVGDAVVGIKRFLFDEKRLTEVKSKPEKTEKPMTQTAKPVVSTAGERPTVPVSRLTGSR